MCWWLASQPQVVDNQTELQTTASCGRKFNLTLPLSKDSLCWVVFNLKILQTDLNTFAWTISLENLIKDQRIFPLVINEN